MMKNKFNLTGIGIVLILVLFLMSFSLIAEEGEIKTEFKEIEKEILTLLDKGGIPGISLVIVKKGQEPYLKGFGYSNLDNKKPVTAGTFFQLASCSKSYTALGALKLARDGFIDLDSPVSHYLPWFYLNYKNKKVKVTIRQVLHQTSGIPFKSIAMIPEMNTKDALEQTIRNIVGIELSTPPGTQYQYATINYDIIGAIIEKVSGLTYEEYMKKHILLPLGLDHTFVGVSETSGMDMAQGHKIGFFSPRKYQAPIYRGNNPAGYIISNGIDMSKWLKLQMGQETSEFQELMKQTHERDRTVPANKQDLSSYAMGWVTYLNGSTIIDHSGANPNFTSYVGFDFQKGIGVAVLGNSNSNYTIFIGKYVLNFLAGRGKLKTSIPPNNLDKGSSVVSFMLGLYVLITIIYIISILFDIVKGRRCFEKLTLRKLGKLLLILLIFVPFIVAIYLVPKTMAGVDMDTAMVWSPISLIAAILMLFGTMLVSYIAIVISTFFPQENKYKRSIPLMIVLSLLSGGANAVVIFLITTSIFSKMELFYQLYNFALAFLVYIIGRKVLQTKLIKITFDIVYDMRLRLIEKIFYTSYQRFEKIDSGRVFATLNDDTNQIGNSANVFVSLITSVVTTIGAFIYLATIAFWATIVTLLVITVIAFLYNAVSQRSQVYFEEARDTRNVYMGQLNGLIDGFKELSLKYHKRREYKNDIAQTCDEFRKKISIALIKFVNAFLIGESMLIVVLGSVGFGISRLFPEVTPITLMGFIMVLLYLIGPINGILGSIPTIMQMRIAWRRVKGFIDDIPANINPEIIEAMDHDIKSVDQLKVSNVKFKFENENKDEEFEVGPIDLEFNKGEIIFIIGGNGSGKTTLAKLLTGLYIPEIGTIELDGKAVSNYQLGECYSVVFGDYHLFEKLYNIDLKGKEEKINEYLKLLKLENKVVLKEGSFSTIDLSGGQRKRLSLLQCYLEDSPIYLFDEIAADQDPEFRKFFYRDLLLRMKKEGKIIIAITHDDHYFDVADRVIKMDLGKLDSKSDGKKYVVTK
jgi:putative ATP-binding cassette transporter